MKARDNPFAVARLDRIRFRPQGVTWDSLLDQLEALEYRAAILGPEGSGKTTLLQDLAPMLRGRGFDVIEIYPSSVEKPMSVVAASLCDVVLTRRHIILLDGADRMGLVGWRRFLWRTKRAGGLIITTHRPGMLPVLIHCRTTPELVEELVGELIPENPDILCRARLLFEQFGGDVRAVMRGLYDVYAARQE